MNSTNDSPSPSRGRLFWHLVLWELRRLAVPLAGWLVVIIPAIVIISQTDWSWPENHDELLRQARRAKQTPVEAGMVLAMALLVYFTGELFISLRPGVPRSRFAFPPRRQDALAAAFLIQAILVLVPLIFYLKGWVMARSWYSGDEDFVRMFVLPVPVFAAGLALVAMLAGDWGMYLLISTGVALGLSWYDSSNWPRSISFSTAALMTIVSVAAAFQSLHRGRRWAILAAWILALAVLLRW